MNYTPFTFIYDSFLSKITDDMFLQFNELDTYRILEDLLLSAIQKFEFPRKNLNDYDLLEIQDQRSYSGQESDNILTEAIIYESGKFNVELTQQECNILAIYMVVEWLSQQLATIENTRMKYSGSDFSFTSQANHMQKILQMKKDYQREGFHMQRLYNRRKIDDNGIYKSTFGTIMSSSD